MLVKDIEETRIIKEYEIRVDKNGQLDPSEYQAIRDNIRKYGYKVVDISGGTEVIILTLEKNDNVNKMIKL